MNSIKIKQAAEGDVSLITQLFFDTIQNINIKDYSKEEVDDWSSWKTDSDKWLERIQEHYFILAEINNQIEEYGSLPEDGCLDFMCAHKDFQG